MTLGQLLFFGGVGLLGLTVVLGIVFLLKKPQYTPENVTYAGAAENGTQKLRSGYPTDRLTIRNDKTEPIQKTARLEDADGQETVPLAENAEQGTVPLAENAERGTVPLAENAERGTVPLAENAEQGIVPLT